jgi:di/tricarboxylate transporter
MDEYIYLAVILIVALYLFWTQKIRSDLTAIIVMLSLIIPFPHLDGKWKSILTYQEGFSGFGSAAAIMVTSMFIFGGAIVKTGAAEFLGVKIFRKYADNEWKLQLSILALTTLASMFINDTTVVLIFMPIIISICKERNLSPTKYLIFAAYGSLLGGQWTLIGTRSNIIISDFLRQKTGSGIGFFDFTPIAVVIFILGTVYLILLGKKVLRGASSGNIQEDNSQREYLAEVVVAEESKSAGKTIDEMEWSKRNDLKVIDVLRGKERIPRWIKLKIGDLIIMQGDVKGISELLKTPDFKLKEEFKIDNETLQSVDLITVEALLSPTSFYAGHTLEELDFNWFYGYTVMGISRHGKTIEERPTRTRLEFGDSLLLLGNIEDLSRLKTNSHLIFLGEQAIPAVGKRKALIVSVLLFGIIITALTGILPPPVTIPLAALLVILFRCIRFQDAYNTIEWSTVVTVAGMIPFGLALEKTGAAEAVAEYIVHSFSGFGSMAVLAAVLLLAVVLTQLIENAAVAIILAPLAYQVAIAMHVDPKPFMVGLAISVSTAFCTPFAHESTILVMGPGKYTFKNYLQIGSALAFISWLIGTLLTPVIWNF